MTRCTRNISLASQSNALRIQVQVMPGLSNSSSDADCMAHVIPRPFAVAKTAHSMQMSAPLIMSASDQAWVKTPVPHSGHFRRQQIHTSFTLLTTGDRYQHASGSTQLSGCSQSRHASDVHWPEDKSAGDVTLQTFAWRRVSSTPCSSLRLRPVMVPSSPFVIHRNKTDGQELPWSQITDARE